MAELFDKTKEALYEIGDGNEALLIFERGVKKLDAKFCKLIMSGNEFCIRLEIRGVKHGLVHCRVSEDDTERPKEKSKINGNRKRK